MPLDVLDYLDPFLLFDHFGSDNARRLSRRLSDAPHRGIETVNVYAGRRRNHTRQPWVTRAASPPGDVQWMTSGRGILRTKKCPNRAMQAGRLSACGQPARQAHDDQAALPRSTRACHPQVRRAKTRVMIRIIAEVWMASMPVTEIAAQPTYLDVLAAGRRRHSRTPSRWDTQPLAYVFDKAGRVRPHLIKRRRATVTHQAGCMARATRCVVTSRNRPLFARWRASHCIADWPLWPVRHEHAPRDRADFARAAQRHIYPTLAIPGKRRA